jgi:hypothetical protein
LTIGQSAAKKLKLKHSSDRGQDSALSVAAVAAAVEAPSPAVPPRSGGATAPDAVAIEADIAYLRLTSGWHNRCFIASTNDAQFHVEPAYRADPPDEHKTSVDMLAEELIQYLKEQVAQLKRESALEEESIAGERLWEYWNTKDIQAEIADVERNEAGTEISLCALAHIHRLRVCVYEPGTEIGSTLLSVKDPRSPDRDAVQVQLKAIYECEGDHLRTVRLLHTGYGGGDYEYDALGSTSRIHFDSLLTKSQLDWETLSVAVGGAPAPTAAPISPAIGCPGPSLGGQYLEPYLYQNQMEDPDVAYAMEDSPDTSPGPHPFITLPPGDDSKPLLGNGSDDDGSSDGSGDDDVDGIIDER